MSTTKKRTAAQAPVIAPQSSKEGSGSLELFIDSGNNAFLVKNYEVALRHYQDALKLAPKDPVVLTKVATAAYKLRDFPTSIKFFLEALEVSPKDKDILYTLGLVYVKSGDRAKSLETYDKLKKVHPEKAENLYKAIYSG